MVKEIERAARIVKKPSLPALWQYMVKWGMKAVLAGRRAVRGSARHL
jgi:hypothetical protein